MPHPIHSSQRRVLMATNGGTLALIAATPIMEGETLGTFALALQIAAARAHRRRLEIDAIPICNG